MLAPHPRRRGAAARTLVVVLAVLAVLVGGALWLLRDTGDPAAISAGATPLAPRPEAAPSVELAGPGGDEEPVRDAATAVAVGPTAAVRLAGEGTLRGVVLERGSGEGVEGAEVELLPTPPVASEVLGRVLRLASLGEETAQRVAPVAKAISGPDGSFSFEGLRTGTYFAQARGPWHVPDAPLQARVTAGEGEEVQLWVREGGRVVGTVELPDGRPAAGVGVALRPGIEELLERARSGDLVFRDARTDDEGRFVIAGVPPAEHWALAAFGRGFALSHAPPVAVRAGEDTEVVLRTREGATLTGRTVTGAATAGDVEPGQPIAGTHVGVVPHGLRDVLFIDHLLAGLHAQASADGQFTLSHVPPGEVDLIAYAPGSLPTLGGSVVVPDASSVDTGDLPLETGPTVSGRVVDAGGEPIAGADVRWEPVDFSNMGFDFNVAPLLTQALPGFAFAKSDADGRFVAGAFPGDPPYRVNVSKPGFASASPSWTPDVDDEELTVVLERGGAVEGIVMDAARRTPLTSFQVDCGDLLPAAPGLTGGDNPFAATLIEHEKGRFRLEPLEPGTTKLVVSAPGYVPAETDELTIVEGETVQGVIVSLEPGATVRGRVFGPGGEAVGGAMVYWAVDGAQERSERNSIPRTRTPTANQIPGGMREYAAALGMFGSAVAHTEPDGTFELIGVPTTTIVVYASQRRWASGVSEPVEVWAGQTTEGVEVQLQEGSTLFGTVRDRFDRVVPRVMVLAVSPTSMQGSKNTAGGLMYQGVTDSEGRYEIKRMAGGGYFVMTARGDEALDPLSLLGSLNLELVTVPDGKRVEYDLIDTSVGATKVRGVVHAGGEPLEGGNLMAMGFESESLLGMDIKIARIRGDGSFEFEGLAAGEYRFQIGEGRLRGERMGGEVRMTVDIPDQPEVVLDLALPSGSVAGVVIDDVTGEPIQNAYLALRALDAPEPTGFLGGMMRGQANTERDWTGEDGVFSFERLEAGRYRLEAGPPRWGGDRDAWAPIEPMEITLREGERYDGLSLRLEPSLGVEGVVRGPDGEPVSGARLFARRGDQDTFLSANARTNEEGDFKLRGLSPGAWDVTVQAEGYSVTVISDVEVGATPGEPLEIQLERGVAVTVRVTEADGRPASGVSARLVPLEGAESGDAGEFFGAFFGGRNSTDAEGLVELGQFRPGPYRLEVQRGLLRAPPREVQLDGDRVELRAQMP